MKRIILFVSATALLIFLALFYYLYIDTLENDVIIEIKRGSGLGSIASQLEENEVIKSEKLFLITTVIKGAHNNMKAGEYEFRKGQSLNDIVDIIIDGRVRLRKITIPEGKNVYEISRILEQNQIAEPQKFLSMVKDRTIIRSETGVDIPSLEGYLFPDTYYFPKNAGAEKVIDTMTDHFFSVFNQLKSENKKSWLSDRDLVILASMIEKETGHDPERDLISSVFHNRLKIGMKLDCDPTVIYGLLPDFDGNLTKRNLRERDNPYNTYTNRGLPPGPIANPGKESLEAAFNPADSDYFYFVSKGDSTHVFSENYNEHIRAVNKHIRNN